MKTKIIYCTLLAVMFASCTKQIDKQLATDEKLNSHSANRLSAINVANSKPAYFIRTTSKASVAAIRARLSSIGALETGYIPQINMLSVTCSATLEAFSAKFKDLNLKIGLTLPVKSPDVLRATELTVQAKTTSISSNNPPSSGDNDTYFQIMWGLDAIDAPQAWNAGYFGKGVVVAVLDEGFYLNHPDITGNFLVAKARNFVNIDFFGEGACVIYPECKPTDVTFKRTGFSHATHVAGIIAAVDNNIGIIGVAPSAKILPIKVISDYFGFGLTSWVAQGIVYAADQGVDVINISLGGLELKGHGKGSNVVQENIKLMNDAIKYANSKGVVVICAAGNNGIDFDHNGAVINMPSGSPHALSISATSPYRFILNPFGNLDIPTSYTNYGSSAINFAAPGGDFDFYPGSFWFYDMVLSTSGPNQYYFAAGTSMASPHAAGVAALIIGKAGHCKLNPAQVKAILAKSADDLGKPGNDPYFGGGRVNAGKAVR